MDKLKKMLPYLFILAADFYLIPLFIRDTGTAMVMLLAVVPFICFGCSVVYGVKNHFHILYSLFAAVLFVPTIFIYYNSSAWIYMIGYGAAAIFGNAIGMLFYKKQA